MLKNKYKMTTTHSHNKQMQNNKEDAFINLTAMQNDHKETAGSHNGSWYAAM